MKKFFASLLFVVMLVTVCFLLESCSKEDFGPQTLDESSGVSQESNIGWLTKSDVLAAKELGHQIVRVCDSNGKFLYSYDEGMWYSLSLHKYYGVDDKGRNILSSKIYVVYVSPDTMVKLRSFMLDKNLTMVRLFEEIAMGDEKRVVIGQILNNN